MASTALPPLHLPESLLAAENPYRRELSVAFAGIVHAAGLLRDFAERKLTTQYKAGEEPVTEADRTVNDYLVTLLRREFPQDEILAEESPAPASLTAPERLWMVDPLDGTKEFIAGNGEFSVMIGLTVHGRPIMGLVARPDPYFCYVAVEGYGTWRIDSTGTRRLTIAPCESTQTSRLVVSRSHRGPLTELMIDELGISHVTPHGSLGLKVGLLCEGLTDIYFNASPMAKLWDICAPMALCQEAGGLITDLGGDPIDFSRLYVERGILAAHPDLHGKLVGRTAVHLPLDAPRVK